jgi:hypothetical protein
LAGFVLLLLPAAAGFAQSESRYALVIGNNNYQNDIAKLENPVKDAEAVAAALRDLGYSVDLKTNCGLDQMETAINTFITKLTRDSEGFFWFAGHGVAVENQHYLLPVDANVSSDSRIIRSGYSVDELLGKFETVKNITNLIILDACRNNVAPKGSRAITDRGLVVVRGDQVQGNKVVYSTAQGQTAADGKPGSANSPFAEAFLHHIKDPEPFNDVFVDIREETMRLTGGQNPITVGDFAVKSYSLNPNGRQQMVVSQAAMQELQVGNVAVAAGSLTINTVTAGQLQILVNGTNRDIGSMPAYAIVPIPQISAGQHTVQMVYTDGHIERKDITVEPDQTVQVDFTYKIQVAIVNPLPVPTPISGPRPISTGRKAGAAVMNLALGIGSFSMGDAGGGLTLLAGYAAAGALIGVELGVLKYEDALAGMLGPIGVGVAGVTVLYGFIRPFIFHKNPQTSSVNRPSRMNLTIIPDATGIKSVGLSYTYHY